MKKILTILFLTFSLQSWTYGDDIRDFQIEGMSIEDSLLDYFNIDEINNMYVVKYPKSTKYIKLGTSLKKFETYKDVTFHIQENDSQYIIHGINGVTFYENKFQECLKQKNIVVESLKSVLINSTPYSYEYEYPGEYKGSFANITDFELSDGSAVRVWCVNWTSDIEKSKNFGDTLSIALSPKYLTDWINTKSQ